MKNNDLCSILRFTLVFIMISSGYGRTQAPEPPAQSLSIEECIERALVHHPLIQAARLGEEVASTRVMRARAQRFVPGFSLTSINSIAPDLRVASGDLLSLDTRNDYSHIGPYTRWEVEFIQPIYTFGGLRSAIEAAESVLEAERGALKQEKDQVVKQIYQVYYGYVLVQELSRVAGEAIDTVRKAEEKLDEWLADPESELTEADRYRLELFRLEVEQKELDLELQGRLTLDTLGAFVGLSRGRSVRPADRFLHPFEESLQNLDHYLKLGESHRPELARLRAGIEAKEALVKIERSRYYPTFFIGGKIVFARAPIRPDIRNPFLKDTFNESFFALGVGLRMSLNFWDTQMRVREAEYERDKLRAQYEGVLMGIQQEIKKAYEEVKVAEKRMENAREALKVARSWLTEEQLTFDLDGTNARTLVDAMRAYLTKKAEYYETIYRYNMALVELHRVTGFPAGFNIKRAQRQEIKE